jgi:hypothetical protein
VAFFICCTQHDIKTNEIKILVMFASEKNTSMITKSLRAFQKHTFLIVALLSSSLMIAQGFVGAATAAPRISDSRTMDAFRDLRNRVDRSATPPENIRGSYYFKEDFKKSRVIYFGEELDGEIYLRYNAYTDEMEIWKGEPGQKNIEEILLKSAKVDCEIDGEYYKLLPYRSKVNNFPLIGYLVVLTQSSKYKLYLQRKKVFMDATQARTSLEQSLPARFTDDITLYYSIGDETPLPLRKSKSGLAKVFKGQEKELKEYLKRENNRLKTNEDYKNVFEYFNQL